MKIDSSILNPGDSAVKRYGFTLVELLVSIVLTMMIIGAIAQVFTISSDTVAVDKARSRIDSHGRRVLEIIEQDLKGCISFDGNQKFIMKNGSSDANGNITYGPSNSNEKNAADNITFRTVTAIADVIQRVEITFILEKKGDRKTVKTERPLFRLIRQVRAPNSTDSWKYDKKAADSSGREIDDHEICANVISFNIEYITSSGFAQLDTNPFPPEDPLGDNDRLYEKAVAPQNPLDRDTAKKNDTDPNKLRCPQIRITLVLTEDITERQERIFTRVFQIPAG